MKLTLAATGRIIGAMEGCSAEICGGGLIRTYPTVTCWPPIIADFADFTVHLPMSRATWQCVICSKPQGLPLLAKRR